MSSKFKMRQEWRTRLVAVDAALRAAAETALAAQIENFLKNDVALPSGSRVAAFRAREIAGEAGVEALLSKASLYRWAFPQSLPDGALKFFHADIPLRTNDFSQSSWGIWEPTTNIEVQPEDFALVLIPLLAFDEKRNRLGWGKGYYDRLLPKTKALRVGVAFSWQESQEYLPTEVHDQKLDFICTEKRIFPSSGRRL